MMTRTEYRVLMFALREGGASATGAAHLFDKGGNHQFRNILRAWHCLRRMAKRSWTARSPGRGGDSRYSDVVFTTTPEGLCACSLYRDQLRRRMEERYKELAEAF